MNDFFKCFVSDAQEIASMKGIPWTIKLNSQGSAADACGWNLTEISGATPPPIYYLRDLGEDDPTLEILKGRSLEVTQATSTHRQKQALAPGWQDLIKAVVIDQLLIRRNTPAHATANIARPLRVLATCAGTHEPWALTVDDASLAFETSKGVQESGKLSDLVFGVIQTVLDANHLVDAGPLSPALTRTKQYKGRRAQYVKSAEELRSNLEGRKHVEKLPERRAFWELVRIVFTEQPKSFLDILRFAQVRLILLTGLRVGEAALVPVDWKRYREYVDYSGRAAGELGGLSRSLMLRHFAEKSRHANEDSLALFETTQHVPAIFEEILSDTLDHVETLTVPLRRTLKLQVETGRMLPDFGRDQLVRAIELYTYLTGNPFVLARPREVTERFIAQHRGKYDQKMFDELRSRQLDCAIARRAGQSSRLNQAVYLFLNRLQGVPRRTAEGDVLDRR